ncbi:hypothetical protein U9M48_022976 [Paspalum notatum var. saurae]|uniref:Uncharacterized protein n=1 Tax=Paspalum notatum var. saurae TaxID=547442 RepID=A0AAQ3TKQ6_PASNO
MPLPPHLPASLPHAATRRQRADARGFLLSSHRSPPAPPSGQRTSDVTTELRVRAVVRRHGVHASRACPPGSTKRIVGYDATRCLFVLTTGALTHWLLLDVDTILSSP